ncbi:hypothetical protein F4778DRAFT_785799 [Xylariomycetidae sp. FL2044]|nr:hypothetical protein F4778DRAFT_785799 [Xylariomycetidae sp. FL2044]
MAPWPKSTILRMLLRGPSRLIIIAACIGAIIVLSLARNGVVAVSSSPSVANAPSCSSSPLMSPAGSLRRQIPYHSSSTGQLGSGSSLSNEGPSPLRNRIPGYRKNPFKHDDITPTGHTHPSPTLSSSSSTPNQSPPRYPLAVEPDQIIMDGPDDVLMRDRDEVEAAKMVKVPIKTRHCAALESIPYGDPVLYEVHLEGAHRKFENMFLFSYTDFEGQRAVQPTGSVRRLHAYFAPLSRSPEEAAGRCDSLMITARLWSCWAQGFSMLEHEIRWVLTVVFDLANTTIARQRACHKCLPIGAADRAAGGESVVFWEARYALHDLVRLVEALKEEFGVTDLTIPTFEWFATS